MVQATEGKTAASGNVTARRLTHGLLALTVLMQPGCMCGCSLPSATRGISANGSMVSVADRAELSPGQTRTGACCPECSPAPEKSHSVPSAP